MEHGCTADEFIVSHGAQSAIGHDMGSGEINPSEPIVIDLWPKDADTACYADMTRTFCIGEVPDELREYHKVAKEALDKSIAALKAGVKGSKVNEVSCEPFHAAGYKTMLSKKPGVTVLLVIAGHYRKGVVIQTAVPTHAPSLPFGLGRATPVAADLALAGVGLVAFAILIDLYVLGLGLGSAIGGGFVWVTRRFRRRRTLVGQAERG